MSTMINEQGKQTFLQNVGLKASQELESMKVTLDQINSFGNKESLREMVLNISKYNKMLNQRITLVNESLTSTIPFTRENLYLFCAYTGSGKSTVAANISFPLWKEKKKVLVISNEESSTDVIYRIACLELGINFNDWKKGLMPPATQIEAVRLFREISTFVKVYDVNENNGMTTKIEGVTNLLEAVKESDFSCIMIDYYQLIKNSTADKTKKTYEVLNDLRAYLGRYIKGSNVPVVLFVQLYSQSKRPSKGSDLDQRIKECSAIVEPATVIVEVVPNFEDKTTDFIIHKDRFGMAGTKITCPFDKGRYCKQLSDREETETRLKVLQEAIKDEKRQPLVSDLQSAQQNAILAHRP